MNKVSARDVLLPLALTQFVASFAGSNMNVAINDIANDLDTSVHGVQIAITLFLLTMAALMIVGSKLTDIWGRKRCLTIGLVVYGLGTVIAAISQGLGLLIVGYSAFEGVGSALMIPPVYIMTTVFFKDLGSRAKAFGRISGAGGIGAAAGPLIGGMITTSISWRASFLLQTLIVISIIFLARKIFDPGIQGEKPRLDLGGAVLSALGMFFVVIGILQLGSNWLLMLLFLAIGASALFWFMEHIRSKERRGEEPLLSTSLFRNRVSNLAMVTQNIQWLMLLGLSFVVSAYLQVVRGRSAIQTGLIFTATTAGILLSSLVQGRLAARFSQRQLIRTGFVISLAGIALLLALVPVSSNLGSFLPGLFVFGVGGGIMLTPSVNVVQSSFPESQQGEISGLSRSVSNLGSSLGTALAGTILVVAVDAGNRAYAYALVALAVAGLIGLAASILLPEKTATGAEVSASPEPSPG